MALAQLTDEQTRTWTREQKDRWWFENIYRGDLPQLTLRSGITGFFLGGILSATNLYIGGKTGVTLGVGLTSVILAFAIFRALARAGVAKDFTILENNAMQSIATAAGYMTVPLIASLAAYMMVTGIIVPWWQMLVWMVIMSIVGVLVAFPMKRRFINEDQLPFPEGRACGVVLDALYHGAAGEGVFKAKLLGIAAGLAALYQFLISDGLQRLIQFSLFRLDRALGMKEAWHFSERIDEYYYLLAAKWQLWTPKILGTEFRTLGLRLTIDAAMLGVGGLMGVRVATSVVLGALFNFVVLAPIMIARGDIAPRVGPTGALVPLSRVEILNQWSLWWGVTMMVVGSLIALAGKPEIFTSAFKNLRGKKKDAAAGDDVLKNIELPLWISFVGVPVFSVLGCYVTHLFFGVPMWLALLSLPLILVLTVICANAMALTSWTPTGSLSKITQFTIGAIDRTNPASNLITGGMTAEVASNASNLLSDIKPGYMLGAKAAAAGDRPRHRHPLGRDRRHAALLCSLSPARCRWPALDGDDRLRRVPDAFRDAMERRGGTDRARRGQPSAVGHHLDDLRCDLRGIYRDHDDHSQEAVPAFLSLDRSRGHPAAGVLPHDVARRDVLLVASAASCGRHARASALGRRHGADLRWPHHRRGLSGNWERAHQRSDFRLTPLRNRVPSRRSSHAQFPKIPT